MFDLLWSLFLSRAALRPAVSSGSGSVRPAAHRLRGVAQRLTEMFLDALD
jgi:hypothetical protein